MTSANKILDCEPPVFCKPKYIENGDPLQDEEKLLQGLPIVEPGDEAFNTIRKVPSDQALMPLRWGTSHRATGRSKSGLQVGLHFGAVVSQPAASCKSCRMFREIHDHAPCLVTSFSVSNHGN